MLGVNFPVVVNGLTYALCGTSASSPLFASFVSLLNALRLQNGSTSVGWLNPMLYSAGGNVTFSGTTTDIFTDITSGMNKCCASQNPEAATCCTAGFTCTTGWDPVTGWGSISFVNLAALGGYEVSSYVSTSSTSDDSHLGGVAIAAITVSVLFAVGAALCYIMGCNRPLSKEERDQWAEPLTGGGYSSSSANPKPEAEMRNSSTQPRPGAYAAPTVVSSGAVV